MNKVESDLHSRLLMARLPAMPQILLKLLEQCQAENTGMSALAELVAKDPGMTCKILGIANSSAYHRSGPKVGLEQSLASLGTDMIKTLVISESVFQVFNGFAHSNGTDLRSFWKHSLSAAVISGAIAKKMGVPNVEEAYLAGLLHDVGRLALLSEANTEYAPIFFAPDDGKLCQIEESLLKLTHPEVGAWLADRWELDSFLSDSLRYHHEPKALVESAPPLVRIVLLAHLLCSHAEGDPALFMAGKLCGLHDDDLKLICKDSRSQVARFADMLGIDLTGADELTIPTDGWDIAGILAETNELRESRALGNRETHAQQPGLPGKMLANEVQNLVLSSELGRSFARQEGKETELLETIVRSARMLFSFEDVAILRLDQAGKLLVGVPVGEHKHRMHDFSVQLAGGGMIAECALQQKIAFISGSRERQNIAIEQLLRILDSQALACLPLASGQRCLGVMIGGIANWQVAVLKERERFLVSFAEQAAFSMKTATVQDEVASRRIDIPAEKPRDVAREVVHEANNALSIIKNYLGVLDGKMEKQGLAVSELSILHEEIDRVSQIIKGLSDPTPQASTNVVEVNRILREVALLFRDTKSGAAAVHISAQTIDSPIEIVGNVGTLKQILVNLIKNGIEAMPDGGDIQIINAGQVNLDGRVYAEITVRDNGPGIAPRILANLFAPGQTTKDDGHQGLGLSIVHGLVKQLQGLISCRSDAKGTSFVMLLPTHRPS